MTTAHPRLAAPLAAAHHLLLLADDVGPGEVPALVRSHVLGAAWASEPTADLPGVLDLLAQDPATTGAIPIHPSSEDAEPKPRATLTGPWRLDLVLRHELTLPDWAARAWVLDVEPERSASAPDIPGGYGPLLDAFGLHHPVGLERQALDLLMACARRLAGAIRTDAGVRLEPDPASAVDLTVYSPTWLDPAALELALATALPSINVMPGVDASQAETLDGYGALWHPPSALSTESAVILDVEAAEVLPAALAGADWPHGGVIAYRLRWSALGPDRAPGTLIEQRHRDEVRTAIERAAVALHAAVGGEILDEDSFLVEPHQLRG